MTVKRKIGNFISGAFALPTNFVTGVAEGSVVALSVGLSVICVLAATSGIAMVAGPLAYLGIGSVALMAVSGIGNVFSKANSLPRKICRNIGRVLGLALPYVVASNVGFFEDKPVILNGGHSSVEKATLYIAQEPVSEKVKGLSIAFEKSATGQSVVAVTAPRQKMNAPKLIA